MARKFMVVFWLLLLTATCCFSAEPQRVSIMTQNLNAGTDLTFAIAELMGVLPSGVGVELTYEEILASDIPGRAALVAARVAEKKPDLLALQEATLWRTGPSVNAATTVLFDQLQLLLSALADHDVAYDVVAVDSLADLAFSKASGGALRMTDRNVLLIRADLRPPDLYVSDVHANTFDAAYSIKAGQVSVQAPCGWISAMVHTGNRHFRLIDTHLQSPISLDPTAVSIQMEQAQQLLHEVRNSTVPVVLAGDFNSDAIKGTGGSGPDNTGTAALIIDAGYTDVGANVLGATWPFYLDDQTPPAFYGHSFPYERIDLIFSLGLNATGVERILSPGPAVNKWPYFGSDHAGVLAFLEF